METNRPDPVLKFLAASASVGYVLIWLAAVVILLGLPMAWVLAKSDWYWGLPGELRLVDTAVQAPVLWGIALDDVRANLRVPVAGLPPSLLALLWTYAGLRFGFVLTFVHQLRSIVRRARDGAPFAPANPKALTRLGWILLGIVVVDGVAGTATARVVAAGLAGADYAVSTGGFIDARTAWLGLVLLALARVFRRGAELEHEQSLVV